jgi:PAS domain S-box-containing protein
MKDSLSIKLYALMGILRQLDNETRMTAAFLAESLGVSERTVYRYMTTLQHAGYPIYFDRERKSYRFAQGFSLKQHIDQPEIYQVLDLKSRMLGSSPVGLLAFAATGRCIVVNDAALCVLGATEDQILSQNYNDLESWRLSGLLQMAQKVMESGDELNSDFHFLTTFGREIWINANMSRITRNGKHFLLLVMQDFTERRRMEKTLAEKEAVLRLFLESSPIYAFIKDEELRYLQVSRNYERLLGKPIDQILGKKATELFPKEFAEKRIVEDLAVLSTGQVHEIVEEFNGTMFTIIKYTFARESKKYLAGYAIARPKQERYAVDSAVSHHHQSE